MPEPQPERTCTYCDDPATHKGEGEEVCTNHIFAPARSEYVKVGGSA